MNDKPSKLKRTAATYAGYRQRRRQHFQQNVDSALVLPEHLIDNKRPAEFSASRRRPAREWSVESDVLVPLGQGLAIGLGSMIALFIFGIWFSWPWIIWVGGASIIGLGWTAIMMIDNRKTVWILEEILHIDLDQDGAVGNPDKIELDIIRKNEAGTFERMFRFNLPAGVTHKMFDDFVNGVLNRQDFTQDRWTGGKTGDFTRPQLKQLLDLLEESEVVERAGTAKNASYRLTPHGERTFRRYALTRAHVPDM